MGKLKTTKPNGGGKFSPKKSPKGAQSPNKGMMNGKGQKTPNNTPKNTPKATPKNTPKIAPKNSPSTPTNTPILKNVGSAKKIKRSAEEDSTTPTKKQKLQMFSGTGLLESGNKKEANIPAKQNTKPSPSENKLKNDNFKKLRDILQKGGKEADKFTKKLREKLADNSAHSDDLSLVLNNTHINKLLRIQPIAGKQNDQQKIKQQKTIVAEESDDSEHDVESTIKTENHEESNDEEDSDDESDEEIDSDGQVVKDEDESDDDENIEGWSGSDNEEDEDEKPIEVKTATKQKPEPKKKQTKGQHVKSEPKHTEQPDQNTQKKVSKRYVAFVGNLPFSVNKEQLVEHFSKAGAIKHIRIPKSDDKKKGFGFVEFSTSEEYEKALSLHHTFILGRRINVLYSEGRKNKKSKAKGLKMKALQSKGILKGSSDKNKKRSERRNKIKADKANK